VYNRNQEKEINSKLFEQPSRLLEQPSRLLEQPYLILKKLSRCSINPLLWKQIELTAVTGQSVSGQSGSGKSVSGQSVSGQSVSEQIRNSYLYPTLRDQKFSFLRVEIISDIENLEISEVIGKFDWIIRDQEWAIWMNGFRNIDGFRKISVILVD